MKLDMDHLLMVLLFLWCSGLWAEEEEEAFIINDPLRLVGGFSRCSGTLEMKFEGEWRRVYITLLTKDKAETFCRALDCGSVVSTRKKRGSSGNVWEFDSGFCFHECVKPGKSRYLQELICSDSIRLVNRTGLCSGRLQVKTDQTNQTWSSVCEDDFDLQDAQVVCRELGCGAPSVLRGGLYGEVNAPFWTKQFHCGGHESMLLDCRSSDLHRNTCSPGKAVGLTCSEPFRLMGGSSRCSGTLEMRHEGEWMPMYVKGWTLKKAGWYCRELNCGSAVSTSLKQGSSDRPVWSIDTFCYTLQPRTVRECASRYTSLTVLEIACSDSVRLVGGTGLCSGRLQVKTDQTNQTWSSVCEDDFDLQVAQVVCRELGCGAPSVLRGGLYGEVDAPLWSKPFQCGGNESALLYCSSSGSDRNPCTPGKSVGLTCSETVQLVAGSSRCSGILRVKQGDWRPVTASDWTMKEVAIACRELDCGSPVSLKQRKGSTRYSWYITPGCLHSGSALRDCVISDSSSSFLEIACSDSIRLVGGAGLCSGRLQVKTDQTNQTWSSVCEDDIDLQDTEVICRELSCGAPSVLQGGLYGDMDAPVWTKQFHCGGNESSLLDCRNSDSDRNTCSSGKPVGLTCSEPLRLKGGSSRCRGTLEMKSGEWRPVNDVWTAKEGAVVCRQLDCGSVISVKVKEVTSNQPVWGMREGCVESGSALSNCIVPDSANTFLEIACSDFVRLVGGPTMCSGRLEVKINETWSTVCESGFDGWDAQVVCRELSCETPAVLRGGQYGDVEALMFTKKFHCGGRESTLQDCSTSGSDKNTCSPGKALELTCSEPVKVAGGTSRCRGALGVKQGEWRLINPSDWALKDVDEICRKLDCGSAVSMSVTMEVMKSPLWTISSECLYSGSALRECVTPSNSANFLKITCSDSVRLVDGAGLCSGRLQVKTDQTNQTWSSVCEDDFDLQDAQVVCRELSCGAPSVLRGGLYGEAGAAVSTKHFQCGGNESALLDCRSSGSDRYTCSPGNAVGLTCSAPVRLVGGTSHCNGTLEVKLGDWTPVYDAEWTMKEVVGMCRQLDCGLALSIDWREDVAKKPVWGVRADCFQSGFALKDCIKPDLSFDTMQITCSDSIRLVDGADLCSGRLEVKTNQTWSSVCEDDFDLQDAQVVCRELSCGAPSVLRGGLYGDIEAAVSTKHFQCGGNESALLDCPSSGSDRNTCSPGKAVGLTCSEPFRLVGGSSRCGGTLEMNYRGEWRTFSKALLTGEEADNLCSDLDCGSAVSFKQKLESSIRSVWTADIICAHSDFRDCMSSSSSRYSINLRCSDEDQLQ